MTASLCRTAVAAIGTVLALITVGCTTSGASSVAPSGGTWATATSAEEGGGMDALVAAARAEGTLNVIALPPDWANYGAIITAFTAKYGVRVVSADPDGSSQDEITAVQRLGTQERAPDVLDVGQSVATANTALFAPYKVTTWDTIPAVNKDAAGAWVNDYGGFVSIGCNATIVARCPTTLADLAGPGYRDQVAINGDPTRAASAFATVWAGALANRGSLDDIAPGVRFWGRVARSGNLLRIDPDDASIRTGRTPIVLDWDYLNVTQTGKNKAAFDWKVTVPADGLFAQYYARRSTRTRRTRPPPGCGRSSCSPTRARTCGWPAGPARCGCPT